MTVTMVSSNTTLSTDNQTVIITGAYTVTLPASPATGQMLYLKSKDSAAQINFNGKIMYYTPTYPDDQGTMIFSDYGSFLSLIIIYDGTQWYTLLNQ